MKFFIREVYRDVSMYVYGMDGEERTYEFFKRVFEYASDIYETTDDERREFNTEGVFTICYREDYESILEILDYVQKAIDTCADLMDEHPEIKKSDFVYNEQYFLV